MQNESVILNLDDDAVLASDAAVDVLASLLPPLADDANKYTRGMLTIVGGSSRYPGAAVLAARASQRMGAGYTEVVCAPETKFAVLMASPSLVVTSWDGWRADSLRPSTPEKPTAVVVGPGFDASDAAQMDLVFSVLEAACCPVVVDGGALTALAQPRALRYLERRAQNGWPTVLTPHGGEAARLAAAWEIDAAAFDQQDLAMELAGRLQAIVALKGPDTVVACATDSFVMDYGGSELAKAGTGDVLAGMLGALLAQGANAFDATFLAVSLHALSGSSAAMELTAFSVTAEDVIDNLPLVLATLVS